MIVVIAFALAFLVLACWFGWKVGRDLKAGSIKVLGGFADRTIEPGRYWFNIAIQVVVMLLFLCVPVFVLLALSFPNCSENPVIKMIMSCPYVAH